MRITILANDKALPNFYSEHGLSIHINHPIYNILFDTGNQDIYLKNAEKIGVDLMDINYIIISHGHYDHAGGIRYFPANNNVKSLIIHKDAFFPKYAKDDFLRFNGIPFKKGSIAWINSLCAEVDDYLKIAPLFYILGDIPNNDLNSKFYLDGKLDDFHDELMLVLEEDEEISVFVGCSHFNIVNGLKKVIEVFPYKRIKNIIAGMHLITSSQEEIEAIGDYLEKLNFDNLIPIHCTGDNAIDYFKSRFRNRCLCLKAGDVYDI